MSLPERSIFFLIAIIALCSIVLQSVNADNACSPSPCGANTDCKVVKGSAVCYCKHGFKGNPLTGCVQAECSNHNDCSALMACLNGDCINPCTGVCGKNANCDVEKHVAVCFCPDGYEGNPFVECTTQELCSSTACGVNTNCEVIDLVPTCSCKKGFIGSPLKGCKRECFEDNDCKPDQMCTEYRCRPLCSQCGKLAECLSFKNHTATCKCPDQYTGNPLKQCIPECKNTSECTDPERTHCINGACVNPCVNVCGINADCNLIDDVPICGCKSGMTGDPFKKCRPLTKQDLCYPNPCGKNTRCKPGLDEKMQLVAICSCLPGFKGNSLTECIQGECSKSDQCKENEACVDATCIDTCKGNCGKGAECVTQNHIAICSCPMGTKGNALVVCENLD